MDIVFVAVVVGLVVVRYVDITRFEGQTSEGEPATLAHWRRYALLMASIPMAMYSLARFAASRGWV